MEITEKSLIRVHDSLQLEINCDCISFCQNPGLEHLMLLGLYELDEKTRVVAGGFNLYDTNSK
jgi:hypothetical protein